ncbi:MAG: RsmG family class I SAM-dependent methyltransferase [Acidimicrobiales bacterium]
MDLGSGGGLPGLVLATGWRESSWVLLDGRLRSTRFLRQAVDELGLGPRVRVVEGRAEVVARSEEHRGRYCVVVARGLGPPAVTAECAAGFLAPGGRLVVSEPPGSAGERWPTAGLSPLGLAFIRVVEDAGGGGYALLAQVEPCPDRFPRRPGIPAKRPLF